MTSPRKRATIMAVFGTRPEAIKMAPVIAALKRRPDAFRTVVTVTAQHREMLDQPLAFFGIRPDHDLDIMTPAQTLAGVATRALERLEPVVRAERPDLVLVQGDTLTTFVAGWSAFFHRVPVAHVEAGLRTGHRYDPFPEEMNRRLTTALAELHFAPTDAARANLLREGVPASDVLVTGNTVIDALLAAVDPAFPFADPVLRSLDFDRRRVIVLTTHRRENLGEPLRRIYLAVRDLVAAFGDVEVVFAVHKNPLVRRVVEEELAGHDRIHLIEPPGYAAFANLMARAYLILTDSGGIQEEAPALGKPVLLLRETTERPEGVAAGTVLRVGTERRRIVEAASRLLVDGSAYEAMARAQNPYGDGRAAERVVGALLYRFGWRSEPPAEFQGSAR